MAFDWIVPRIRCRVIIPFSSILLITSEARWFHQRAVTIDKLDSVWDNDGDDIPLALVRVDGKQLWSEYDWLKPLAASSVCICPLQRLFSQGCKCGGI